jgi:plastocyanin
MHAFRLLFPLLLAATPGPDAERPASKADVQELKAEVQELRTLLVHMLEADEARLSALRAALNEARGKKESVAARTEEKSTTAKSEKPMSPARAGAEKGTISGRVTLSGGSPSTLVYAYVEDVHGKLVKNKTVEVKQVDKQFAPSALVVQRGTKVVFPNLDKISHNVFSLTPGSAFDLGTYQAGDRPGAYTFTQPGPVEVFCNLHAQMAATILVVPGPFYAKAGADGRFVLKDVPAGRHKLVVWTPNVPIVSQTIEVNPGQDATADITIQASAAPPKHTDKNGMPYGSYQ